MSSAKTSFKRIVNARKLKKCASLCSDNENLNIDQEFKKAQRGRSAEQLRKIKTELQLKEDLNLDDDAGDDDILFPYDASKRLSNQVEALLEENVKLRKSLIEAEARLRGVVTACPPAMAAHGRASDLAASKIVELSKRVRELTADLEVARMRCRNFELASITSSSTIKDSNSQSQQAAGDDKDNNKSQDSQIRELTEKLSSSNLKVCEYRNQCQHLKHELKLAHKALVSEVGEGTTVISVMSAVGGGGWRGRAQQIQALQQRLSELSEKTSNPDIVEKEAKKAISVARLAEKELRILHERELASVREQLEDKHKKLEAAKARSRVLENSVSELRGRVTTLLEKTAHDDQLISALTAQLSSSDKIQDRITTNRLEQHTKLIEQQLAEERSKSNYLQSALHEKEKELSILEDKLVDLQSTIDKDPAEKPRSASTELNPNPTAETLGVAADAERLRLLELLGVTNKRLEQERQLATQTQDILRRERHKAARLETKLARQELERVGVSTRNGYLSTSSLKATEILAEELKCKVELLEEEVLYLRSRLSSVEQEKNDDLRTYTNMLENSRQAFLDAVKNLSASSNFPL